MSATVACPDRISPHPVAPTLPALPADPAGREQVLADAVTAAVLLLVKQLSDPDPKMAHKAACQILALEKARLLHGRAVIGTVESSGGAGNGLPPLEESLFAASETSGVAGPAPFSRGEEEKGVNRADPFEVYVDRVQQMLQGWEDQSGFHHIVISREEARQYALEELDRKRKQNPAAGGSSERAKPTG